MRITPKINGKANITLLPLKEVTRIRIKGKTSEIDSTNRSKGNQSPRLHSNATKELDSHTLGNIKPNRVDVWSPTIPRIAVIYAIISDEVSDRSVVSMTLQKYVLSRWSSDFIIIEPPHDVNIHLCSWRSCEVWVSWNSSKPPIILSAVCASKFHAYFFEGRSCFGIPLIKTLFRE